MKKKRPLLSDLAEELIVLGKKEGADEMEVSIIDGYEFRADIRFGEIENLLEAGSRYLSIRIIKDQKTAYVTSSDLSNETLQHLLKKSIQRAVLANPDEYAGLPPISPQKIDPQSLKLHDPEIPELPPEKKITLAKETEKIALQDKRITNSHGASFDTNQIKFILANSNGFLDEYEQTLCSLSLGLQAGETDSRVEDYWFSSKRHFHDLDSAEEVALRAIERTVRQLNPRKIKTQKVPVVFESLMTSWLLGFLFSCVSGMSIYQKTSFLVDRLGKKIGNEKITIFDDGLLPGKLGSKPFDSEGVPCQKTPVVEKGILKNYLCNTYAARKLRLKSTGNAAGASVGPHNFYLQPGNHTPEEIVASVDKGLMLIRTLGHGLNPVTGDISRGAFGLWIEKGEVAYPVSEITISGNLGNILNQVEMVGNDLDFNTPVAGPTIKIQELTVAGQ